MLQFILEFPLFYRFFQKINGSDEMHKKLVENFIQPQSGDDVLDIGCGPCDILELLGEVNYIGCDLNEKYIQLAKKRYKNNTNAHFVCMDLNDFLNTNTKNFDIILLLGVMHHIDDVAVHSCLQSISSIATENTKIITLDGIYTENMTFFQKLLLKLDRGKFIRKKMKWLELFFEYFPDYTYTISNKLYPLPYNLIIFHK